MSLSPGRCRRRLIVALLMLCGLPAQAAVFEHQETVRIRKLQNVRDDLYVLGADQTRIEGFVAGDLVSFSGATAVEGEVGRSVNVFSRNVSITGTVKGSVRAFAEHTEINGYVGGSLLLFARSLDIKPDAVVDHSADLFGQNVVIEGTLRGNARVTGAAVSISGIVEGDLEITADTITIATPAVIRGNLTYTAPTETAIALDEGVIVVGDIVYQPPEEPSETSPPNHLRDWILRLAGMLAAFVFGIIMARLFQPYAAEALLQLRSRAGIALAGGIVVALVTILCATVLLISLLLFLFGMMTSGGSLAALGMVLLVVSFLLIPVASFGGVTGAVLFYSGKILVGFWLGGTLLKRRQPGLAPGALLLGLAALTLVYAIPYLGAVVYLLTALIGAGGIFLGIQHCRRVTMPPSGTPSSGSDSPA